MNVDGTNNPLLNWQDTPPFDQITPAHIEPALDQVLAENRAALQALLAQKGAFTWGNLMQPLDEMGDRLDKVWSPAQHLHSVADSAALRKAFDACLPKLSAYSTEMGQHEALYQAIQAIKDSPAYQALDGAQHKVIEDALRDFRLSGVALSKDDKARYKAIQQELTSLSNQFSKNVLDATDAWKVHVTDAAQVEGIPEHNKQAFARAAKATDKPGWLIGLEAPDYIAVVTYAEDRKLREKLYRAYTTRASDQGPDAGRWDNTDLIKKIVALRDEKAKLLGFENYVAYSLATKMADNADEVIHFLQDLSKRACDQGRDELAALQQFAAQEGVATLAAWDVAYFSEKMRQAKYAVSQEMLRAYFPIDRVLAGLFSLAERLYDIHIKEKTGLPVWHDAARYFEISDSAGKRRGAFYLDLYARAHKRGGAWMDECQVRRRSKSDAIQLPVAYLVCNFSAPAADQVARLTHDDVTTLFHEFGHGLHHLLTQVDYPSVSGINGVPWDAVELPSQFMEHFCWQEEVLSMISEHAETKESLPKALFNKMLAAKNFQSAMQLLRQIEFALFDITLHQKGDAVQSVPVQKILDDVREQVAVFLPPAFNRFQNSFTHVFSGGYAAGYYSYLWADLLACDAFSLFKEKGIFNKQAGTAFLKNILEQGGTRQPMELFIDFRGRPPRIDALLQDKGINNIGTT